MLTLMIMRHAKAADLQAGGDDKRRRLTPHGRDEAIAVGQALVGLGLVPDRIVCSGATRAGQTARIVAQQCGCPQRPTVAAALYYPSMDDYLAVVRGLKDAWRSVVVVGHNPVSSELAGLLVGAAVDLPTAGLAILDLDVGQWSEVTATHIGQLRQLIEP